MEDGGRTNVDNRSPADVAAASNSTPPGDTASALLAETVDTLAKLTTPDTAESYRMLAEAEGAILLTEADRHLGEQGITARLLEMGLAYVLPQEPPALAAAASVPAIEAALAHKRHELNAQYEALVRAHQDEARIRQLAERQLRQSPSHRLARVLTDSDEIAALSNTIGTAATEEHLTLDTFRYDLPPTANSALPPTSSALTRGVRHRGIYETAFLSDPVGADILGRCAAAGEEIRLLPELPMKMKITDRSQALLALTPTGSSAALHVTSPVAVDALRHYFDLLWCSARPLTLPSPGNGSERERQRNEVAVLMREGFKDEAIARRLDLTPRTVRRRISELMNELAAETRFAAGAEAQRRGWFDTPG